MKKRLSMFGVIIAMLVAAAFTPASNPADCCARVCGGDKNCEYICRHDPGGPCSTGFQQ
ncbi:MAG TPA: hypothetical protein VER08_07400 [Pyrinomonadaceae bacterium]|nr:hypothetical protein [Pyrinomonadaceae bacterium]